MRDKNHKDSGVFIMGLLVFGTLVWLSLGAIAEAGIVICPEPREKVPPPYFCTNPVAEGRIANGDEWAAAAKGYLNDLRDGVDPEVVVPLLADSLKKTDVTLAWFATDTNEIARAVLAYYGRTNDSWLRDMWNTGSQLPVSTLFARLRATHELETHVLELVYYYFPVSGPATIGATTEIQAPAEVPHMPQMPR